MSVLGRISLGVGVTVVATSLAMVGAAPGNAAAIPSVTVSATVQLSGTPAGIAVDSTTGEVFVLTTSAGNETLVDVIDPSSKSRVASVDLGAATAADSYSIAVDSTQHKVYLYAGASGVVSVIDEASNRVTSTFTVPVSWSLPDGREAPIAVDEADQRLYLVNSENSIIVVDSTTGAEVATVTTPTYAAQLVVDSASRALYVLSTPLLTVNMDTLAVTAGETPTDSSQVPQMLALDPGSHKLIGVLPDDTLEEFLPSSNGLVAGSTSCLVANQGQCDDAGMEISGMVVDPVVGALVLSGGGSGSDEAGPAELVAAQTAALIDGQYQQILPDADVDLNFVNVGANPSGIAFDPADGALFTASATADTLSMVTSGTPPTVSMPSSLTAPLALGAAVSAQLSTSGGTAPYTYSYTGDLPPGLSLDPATGVLSGAPSGSAPYEYEAILYSTDAFGAVASRVVDLSVEPVLSSSVPTIAGTAKVGSILTANPGVWTAGTTFTYQWYANGVAISGASSSTLSLTSTQAGKQIVVDVAGQLSGYARVVRGSVATAAVAASPTPVLSSSAPTVTGSATVGSTLTANPGTWTSGTTFTYQWYANGTAIPGASRSTLVLAAAQLNKEIVVDIAGHLTGYPTTVRGSVATVPVVSPPSLLSSVPTISGTTKVGSTLTANPGTWTSGTTFTYQWYANGAAIAGASKSTLALTAAQLGKKVVVDIAGHEAGWSSVVRGSAATVAVAPGTLTETAPSISGTAKVGSTLMAVGGLVTPNVPGTYQWSYQWYANGAAIPGASNGMLKLTSTQLGKKIVVDVAVQLAGYTRAVRGSAATTAVAP